MSCVEMQVEHLTTKERRETILKWVSSDVNVARIVERYDGLCTANELWDFWFSGLTASSISLESQVYPGVFYGYLPCSQQIQPEGRFFCCGRFALWYFLPLKQHREPFANLLQALHGTLHDIYGTNNLYRPTMVYRVSPLKRIRPQLDPDVIYLASFHIHRTTYTDGFRPALDVTNVCVLGPPAPFSMDTLYIREFQR